MFTRRVEQLGDDLALRDEFRSRTWPCLLARAMESSESMIR